MKYVYEILNLDEGHTFKVFESNREIEHIKEAIKLEAERYIKDIPLLNEKRINIINEDIGDISVESQDAVADKLLALTDDYSVKLANGFVVNATDFVESSYVNGKFVYGLTATRIWTLDEWFDHIAETCKA